MAELLGSLLVRLGLESGAFKSGLDTSTKEFKAAQKNFEKIGKSFDDIGKKMTLGITLPLTAMAVQAVKGAQEQRAAMAQVESALESMGNVSGKTAAELAKTADALEMKSLIDADVILSKVTANLLTFGNVAGEVFDRAQQAAIDMSTRMGSDPQSAAIMLGKALNDPIKGITALGRVGVQLTEGQKAQIKSFVALGQTAKAQGLILTEVEKQFAGAAQAAADTQPLRQATVAWNQAMDQIGEAILPVIPVITDAVVKLAQAFQDLSPEAQKIVIIGAAIAAALGPVLVVIGALINMAAPLLAAMTTSAAATTAAGGAAAGASTGFAALAAAAAPWIALGAAVAGAAYLIYQNWDKIAPVLQGLWETIKSTLGPPLMNLIGAVKDAFTALWEGPLGTMLQAVGAMLLDAFSGALPGVIQVLTSLLAGVFNLIADSIRLVVSLLSGDWAGAWEAAKDLVGNAASAIGGILEGLGTAIGSWVTAAGKALGVDVPAAWERTKAAASDAAQAVGHHMQGLAALARGDFAGAWEHAKDAVGSLGDALGIDLRGALDAALGYVRALVNGVRDWMVGRLSAIWDDVRTKIANVKRVFYDLYDAVVGHSYIPDMVDQIGVHMRRLDKELAEPAKKAATKAEEAFRSLQQNVASILSRLFPDQAAAINYEKELAALNQYFDALIKRGADALAIEQQRLAAVTALRREYSGWDAYVEAEASKPIEVMPGTVTIEDANTEILDKIGVTFGKVGEQAEAMKVKVVESFGQLVDGAINELDRFVRSIESGDWLDVLSSVLNIIQKVGAVVTGNPEFDVFSSGGGTPPIAGARAAGGPVLAGRPYLVGEEGAEIFKPQVSGTIIPNGGIGGGSIATIVPSPYFDVVVDGRVMRAGPGIAQAGSIEAQQAMHRSAQWRVA